MNDIDAEGRKEGIVRSFVGRIACVCVRLFSPSNTSFSGSQEFRSKSRVVLVLLVQHGRHRHANYLLQLHIPHIPFIHSHYPLAQFSSSSAPFAIHLLPAHCTCTHTYYIYTCMYIPNYNITTLPPNSTHLPIPEPESYICIGASPEFSVPEKIRGLF